MTYFNLLPIHFLPCNRNNFKKILVVMPQLRCFSTLDLKVLSGRCGIL